MLLTLKIKLLPTNEQREKLLKTMRAFNAACDYISQKAFSTSTFHQSGVHRLTYYEAREKFLLSSQMAVRAVGKVCDSYKLDKKTLRTFQPLGAIVYDQRILSFNGLETASILTLDGRIKVPMVFAEYHDGLVKGNHVRGQADLCYIDGEFYLMLVVDIPNAPKGKPIEYLGVDFGIVQIASTSDGDSFCGKAVRNVRYRNQKLRKKLQAKQTKSAKRLLKKRRRKEQRFSTWVNHNISKKIVNVAKDTQRGIAIEDLNGIRERVNTVRKAQRIALSNWAFYQLRQFLTYKAFLNGVELVAVDPRNTSRTCPKCGNIDKKNRKTQSKFQCTACGFVANADINAAGNIASRAVVNQPYAEVA
ncbi:MAG: transposase [Patescibacteria group bacterium]|jgi:IS605 OrfB family transposase